MVEYTKRLKSLSYENFMKRLTNTERLIKMKNTLIEIFGIPRMS